MGVQASIEGASIDNRASARAGLRCAASLGLALWGCGADGGAGAGPDAGAGATTGLIGSCDYYVTIAGASYHSCFEFRGPISEADRAQRRMVCLAAVTRSPAPSWRTTEGCSPATARGYCTQLYPAGVSSNTYVYAGYPGTVDDDRAACVASADTRPSTPPTYGVWTSL